MATVQQIDGDMIVRGTMRATTLPIPSGTVVNDDVGAAADIDATKLEHQNAISYYQDDGTDIAAAIVPIHIVYGTTATIVAFEVVCLDAPEGGDKKFTVDLMKSNVGTPAPATVLTGVVDYVVDTPDCTVLAGTINSTALVDGDVLVVQVAVSGSTGNQGQGLIVTATVREDAV